MKKICTLFSAAMLAVSSAGFAQTIMLQDFESATMPALPTGWTQHTKAVTGWKTNSGIIKTNGGKWTTPAHSKYAVVDDWNNNEDNDSTLLISPSFSLVGHPNAQVAVDYYFILASYSGNPKETAYIRVSIDGGNTWTNIDTLKGSATDWQYSFKSLSAYAGKPDVRIGLYYSDGSGGAKMLPGLAVDYIKVYDPKPSDIRLLSMTPAFGENTSYGLSGANLNIGGTVINYGSAAITTFSATFQQGASGPVTNSVTGVNIPSFSTQAFTCNNPLVLPSAVGAYPVNMWVALTGDNDATNDSANTVVTVASFKPVKKILVEEGTGTWCGWCPRGAVYMDSLDHTYPSTFSLVAVHNADPMTVSAYDALVSGKIGGYPSVLIDRHDVLDPSELLGVYNSQKDNFGFAEIKMADLGASSFDLSIKVSVKPAVDLTGDYRLALILTENDVHGQSGSSWGQHNYYSSTSANQPLTGAGHVWQSEPATIPGEQMIYQFVGRAILPSPTGAAGSLPATMTAGTTYDYTFNTTVAQPYNRPNMHVIAIMIRNSDGNVMNSSEMVMPLGISNVAAGIQHLSVYPNPATDVTHLVFNLDENAKVQVQVLNAIGQVVNTIAEQQYTQGEQQITINTAALAPGIYTIKLQTEKGSLTQQLSIAK